MSELSPLEKIVIKPAVAANHTWSSVVRPGPGDETYLEYAGTALPPKERNNWKSAWKHSRHELLKYLYNRKKDYKGKTVVVVQVVPYHDHPTMIDNLFPEVSGASWVEKADDSDEESDLKVTVLSKEASLGVMTSLRIEDNDTDPEAVNLQPLSVLHVLYEDPRYKATDDALNEALDETGNLPVKPPVTSLGQYEHEDEDAAGVQSGQWATGYYDNIVHMIGGKTKHAIPVLIGTYPGITILAHQFRSPVFFPGLKPKIATTERLK